MKTGRNRHKMNKQSEKSSVSRRSKGSEEMGLFDVHECSYSANEH